MVKEGQEDVT